jgi:hypothetical protein
MKKEIRDKLNNQLIFKSNSKGIYYFRKQDKTEVLLPWFEVLNIDRELHDEMEKEYIN